jgi:quercetin dioxygenase-like cupin family protein
MNLKNVFLSLEKYFSPKIIGEVNDQYIKVVKIKGQEAPWHIHENEDELFYIAKGTLLMEIENQPDLTLKKGDLFVVNKERNHAVRD